MTEPRIEPVDGLEPLHTVPRPALHKDGATLTVELVDERDQRIELAFRPVQAVRILTVDLWEPPGDLGRRVCEIRESPWRAELAERLAELHPTASFMDQARHFVVPGGDDVIEVLAWELSWQPRG